MALSSIIRRKPKLDARLGRALYGNLCSFSYNFEGRRNLRRLRADGPRPSAAAAEFLGSMARDGFYQLPEPLSSHVMIGVVEIYRAALADSTRSAAVMSLRAQQDGLDVYCRAVEDKDVPELRQLITAEVKTLVESYFGGEPKIIMSCARRTEHVPPAIAREYDIYSNSWHCDNEPSDRLKMFVALNDITDVSGPLHLLSRKRTRQLLREGFKNRDDTGIPLEKIEDPAYLVKFTGPVGSVMFTNVTQCLHRAGVPASGQFRDIAEFQFRTE
ncbi:hypothetical protein ML401_23160 [Bradyrhizobium sp. 62B]|uniref:hypothetical protein n=1 Tax=Bradyrhizobium sp. 62B TaxID=2898442 RepID=UPI002557DFFA|nr:hypothetical protein ML401_23160 [Bradyrhizobium sp. 62B]